MICFYRLGRQRDGPNFADQSFFVGFRECSKGVSSVGAPVMQGGVPFNSMCACGGLLVILQGIYTGHIFYSVNFHGAGTSFMEYTMV